MSFLIFIPLTIAGPVLAAWLLQRNRFEDRSLRNYLRFLAGYIANKWKKKPDFWSCIYAVKRSIQSINAPHQGGGHGNQMLRRITGSDHFLISTGEYADRKDQIRSMFPVEQPDIFKSTFEKFHAHTLIALHLRVSTWACGHGPWFIAPNEWYLERLRLQWPGLFQPVLFIASDVPEKVLKDFAFYDPWTCKRLGIRIKPDLLGDFTMLRHADIMAISNSTFGFTASMLNEQGKLFVRPDNVEKKLVRYDPWDAEPLLIP